MFTRRNEHELGEIKALMYELGHNVQEIQQRLERIEGAQDRPASDDRTVGAGKRKGAKGKKAARRRRQAELAQAPASDEE
jgi:hypothetical protein